MKSKLSLLALMTVCVTQVGFALPQVADAEESSSSAGYLASAGPIATPEVSTNTTPQNPNINDDLLTRFHALEQNVQTLQGQVDELQHALKQSQTEAAQQFLILNKKLVATPTPAPVKAAATPVAASIIPTKMPIAAVAPLTSDAQEKATYDAAYGLVSAKAYADAIEAFTSYLTIYPDGKYASNANYWLGELNANQQAYPAALQYLQMVVDKYPQSTKAPDALLKIGIVNKRLGNDAKSQAAFKQLIQKYPQSSAVKSAKEYIS
jgi:tol-pal system protein YbgF